MSDRSRVSTEEILDTFRRKGVKAREFTDEEKDRLNARNTSLTFFGEPRRAPEPGERVLVRVEDGSWRDGYRAISEPTADEEYPGEWVLWIAAEEEWTLARAEGREAAGAPWPAAQLAAVEEGGERE